MPRRKKDTTAAADDQGHARGRKVQEPARVITMQNATDEELAELAEAKADILAKVEARGQINNEIAATRKGLKSKGWNLEGFDLACKLAAMDPAKRRAVDITLFLTREALEIPIAQDLFAHAERAEGTTGAEPQAHATH
jgi:hypothetical protein